ncbi:MAG: hypothetical protein GX154_12540 [Clostridiales bacterium]|jgi:hypothetical protein|nr:hypothetical protein [Clostridiales bacterium]
MIITIIYRLLVAFVLFVTLWNLFTEKNLHKQMNAALVIIPLILRVLMIK